MFTHHKINSIKTDQEWLQLKKTISPQIAYKSAETIGQYAADDMLSFANVDKSNISRIFVKYRDGLPMAAGIRKILPKSDIIYITTERFGRANEEVHTAIDNNDYNNDDSNPILYFADPVNARGTTSISVLRQLKQEFSYDKVLLSHIVANRVGIHQVQTLISDFNIPGFMNYAFLSKRLNKETGYLEDGLELIPDFGDKVFGTIGGDYSENQMQEDIKKLLGTKVGDTELMKGVILFLLQLRGRYDTERPATWATKNWIKAVVLWYIKMRNLPINIDIKHHFDSVLYDLKCRGFINSMSYPYKKSQVPVYSVTDSGIKLSSKTYLAVIDQSGFPQIIVKDFDWLVYRTAGEILQYIQNDNT